MPVIDRERVILQERQKFMATRRERVHVKTAPWVTGPQRFGLVDMHQVRATLGEGEVTVYLPNGERELYPNLSAMLETWIGD